MHLPERSGRDNETCVVSGYPTSTVPVSPAALSNRPPTLLVLGTSLQGLIVVCSVVVCAIVGVT